MVIVVLTFLLFLPLSYAPAQPSSEGRDMLRWNEFYNLQWDDFQGKPGSDAVGDAGTAVHIKATPFLVKGRIHYNIDAFFNRGKSWIRDKSPSLLAHEQLHFDIAEWYARKIREKVRQLQNAGIKDIKTYNTAIKALLLESNQVDQQYDLETLHGALTKKQAAWSQKVEDELMRLRNFKKSRRIIGGANAKP